MVILQPASINVQVRLSNGRHMPVHGLGTAWSKEKKPREVEDAVITALDAGYRLIDTASRYDNETEIGNALEEYFATGKLKREDVFLTTKLWCTHLRPENAEIAIRESLAKLRTDYVDLYLAHMPTAFNHDLSEQDTSVTVEDIWRGLESLYEKGLTRAIGVSNFNAQQIQRILKIAKVPIHNVQVELHLHFAQFNLHKLCKRNNITLTAYAPLGSPHKASTISATSITSGGRIITYAESHKPLDYPTVQFLAKKYNKTPAQVLLRHLIQRGIAIVPKSANPGRVKENFAIYDFELTREEVAELNRAPQGQRFFNQERLAGHPEDPFANERPQTKVSHFKIVKDRSRRFLSMPRSIRSS